MDRMDVSVALSALKLDLYTLQDCLQRALKGECDKRPGVMLRMCRRSCCNCNGKREMTELTAEGVRITDISGVFKSDLAVQFSIFYQYNFLQEVG